MKVEEKERERRGETKEDGKTGSKKGEERKEAGKQRRKERKQGRRGKAKRTKKWEQKGKEKESTTNCFPGFVLTLEVYFSLTVNNFPLSGSLAKGHRNIYIPRAISSEY